MKNKNEKECDVISLQKAEEKYRILCQLERSRNSTVYLAEDIMNKKACIIKRVSRKTFPDYYEGNILSLLKHPDIVRLLEQIEDDEYYYLVMEYCCGVTMKQYVKVQKPTFEQILLWGMELCDILIYLQKKVPAIVHRDIKPSNIILINEKQLKLIDFGIARCTGMAEKKAYGTRLFAAPEQFKGRYSGKTDVYNLAATLDWCWKGTRSRYWKRLMKRAKHFIPEKRYTPGQLKRRLQWLYFWNE